MTCDGVPRDDAVCRKILGTKDHYEALEVPRQADEAVLKAAFRRRAREVHPDKNASPLASDAFKRLQKASEVLTDARSRRRYDVTGDDKPRQPTVFRAYNPRYGAFDGSPVLIPSLIPMVVAMMVATTLFTLGGVMFSENIGDVHQHQHWGHQRPKKRRKQQEESAVLHLTRSNADAACGVVGKKFCVVLLTDPQRQYGDRETKLLEKVREDAEKNVKTARGQSLPLKWAAAEAGPRWRRLLPAQATLPWVLVIKSTRAGLRVSPMPVPKAGGKEKGRLSVGVPSLLQEVAIGTAKFEPIQGNVSALFGS